MKELQLFTDGLNYLRSVLQNGDCLAQSLLKCLPLEGGRVTTFLPDQIAISCLSLSEGGLSKFEYDDDLRAPLVTLISEFMGVSPLNLAVVEAASVSREDLSTWISQVRKGVQFITTALTTRRARKAITQEEISLIGVYGMMTDHQADRTSITELIDEAFPFHQIGALTSLPEGKSLKSGDQVDAELLELLASRAMYIFAGAFDGDGWVIWGRSEALD